MNYHNNIKWHPTQQGVILLQVKTIVLVLLTQLGMSVSTLFAQQWGGSTTISGTISREGKVGIGTETPTYPLHVKSASNANVKIEGGNTGYANLRIRAGTDTDPSGWQLWTDIENNHLDFYHAGSKMTLTTDGKLGLGTTDPQDLLHLNSATNTSLRIEGGTNGYANIRLRSGSDTSPYGWEIWTDPTHNFLDFFHSGSRMTLLKNGHLGIGTSNPGSKLTVNGDIHAKEVRVDLNVPGPDYVFAEDYDLPTLESIESYIRENKHLPEVPSAKEMEANGIDVGVMNMLLLKKVEELTLHLIELKRENKKIKEVNDFILQRIKELER